MNGKWFEEKTIKAHRNDHISSGLEGPQAESTDFLPEARPMINLPDSTEAKVVRPPISKIEDGTSFLRKHITTRKLEDAKA